MSILFLRVADFGSTNSVSFSSALHNKAFRHDAVLRVYDDAGNVIETHEHNGEFNPLASANNPRTNSGQSLFVRSFPRECERTDALTIVFESDGK